MKKSILLLIASILSLSPIYGLTPKELGQKVIGYANEEDYKGYRSLFLKESLENVNDSTIRREFKRCSGKEFLEKQIFELKPLKPDR
ncbi:MAG: hypothetical protein HQL32_01890 [Planctomycetes bacterium]|nr:hypothetical protein [Planctomycetota bacterium]